MISRLGLPILLLFSAAPAFASVSPEYLDWRNGPVQWIMTPEEQRSWRSITSDAAAIEFIDLFWLRRDPSPGTARNEFREEFESRVVYADEHYGELKQRGAMSDRGRVLIVLGSPTNIGLVHGAGGRQSVLEGGEIDPGGGRGMGRTETWTWNREDAQLFGMSRILVVFTEDAQTRAIRRDVQKNDFVRASRNAIQSAIVNPSITELPPWAPRGGLVQRVLVQEMPPPVASPRASGDEESFDDSESTAPVDATTAATRLFLTADPTSFDAQARSDPFGRLSDIDTFTAGDELGWLARYCSATPQPPPLEYQIRISGEGAGRKIDRASAPDEIVPERLRAVPGCYLLRGAIPLTGMPAGTFALEVMIDEIETGRSLELKQSFRIEEE